MISRGFVVASRRNLRLRRPLQLAVILAFWLAGEFVVRWSGVPVPGGIVGMFLVLALLASRRLSMASLRLGANWLIAEMLLFFVPAVLAMLDHREFLGLLGLKVLAVILLGTVVVMSVTALTADICFRWLYTSGSSGHAGD